MLILHFNQMRLCACGFYEWEHIFFECKPNIWTAIVIDSNLLLARSLARIQFAQRELCGSLNEFDACI